MHTPDSTTSFSGTLQVASPGLDVDMFRGTLRNDQSDALEAYTLALETTPIDYVDELQVGDAVVIGVVPSREATVGINLFVTGPVAGIRAGSW